MSEVMIPRVGDYAEIWIEPVRPNITWRRASEVQPPPWRREKFLIVQVNKNDFRISLQGTPLEAASFSAGWIDESVPGGKRQSTFLMSLSEMPRNGIVIIPRKKKKCRSCHR